MRFSVIIFLSLVAGSGPQPWVLSRKVWPRHELTAPVQGDIGVSGVMWQLLGGQSGEQGPIPDRPARQTRPMGGRLLPGPARLLARYQVCAQLREGEYRGDFKSGACYSFVVCPVVRMILSVFCPRSNNPQANSRVLETVELNYWLGIIWQ